MSNGNGTHISSSSPHGKRRRPEDEGEGGCEKKIANAHHPHGQDGPDFSPSRTSTSLHPFSPSTLSSVPIISQNSSSWRHCSYFRFGRCTRLGPAPYTCSFLHEACPHGIDCLDYQHCRKGHPRAWEDKREWSRPCRRLRLTGRCPYQAKDGKDECRYQHVMCQEGKDCQNGSCQWGHPRAWRCKGCEKCGGGQEGQGVVGAGVLLLSPSHCPDEFDLVLVAEEGRNGVSGREWGEMGGRSGPHPEPDSEDREAIAAVAARELEEETAGTVRVAPVRLVTCPFVDIGIFHRYRCYVLAVVKEEASVGVFQRARKKPGLPRAWRETCDMKRFPLQRVVEEMGAKGRRRRDGGNEVVERREEEEKDKLKKMDEGQEEGEDGEEDGEEEGEEEGVLLGDYIYSHKGKAHLLASRAKEVLTAAFRQGMLDSYV